MANKTAILNTTPTTPSQPWQLTPLFTCMDQSIKRIIRGRNSTPSLTPVPPPDHKLNRRSWVVVFIRGSNRVIRRRLMWIRSIGRRYIKVNHIWRRVGRRGATTLKIMAPWPQLPMCRKWTNKIMDLLGCRVRLRRITGRLTNKAECKTEAKVM